MLLIYTPDITERIKYTFALFFNQLIKVNYLITSSEEEFAQYEGSKFSYAFENKFGSALYFKSTTLLFEANIVEYNPKPLKAKCESKELIGFFEVNECSFPFDVFASAFYLVSRYEEYVTGKHDHFGRFKDEYSIASHYGFLDKPMVNYYAMAVKSILQNHFSDLKFEEPKFSVSNTVDVDMAWKYKHKGVSRNISGFARDLVNTRFDLVKERFEILVLGKEDPFNSFDYLLVQSKGKQIPICFFWLLGSYAELDKNINRENAYFKSLMKRVDEKADSGIHFSYKGHHQRKSFDEEFASLEHTLGRKVTKNRFHFLKLDITKSFYKLINLGIKEEYSLGYSAHSGFRASIASPFYWFDLTLNQQTDLLIKPLVFMDATIRYHKPMGDEKVMQHIDVLLQRAHEVNGHFIALWHNDIFDDRKNYWKMIFEWFNKRAATLMQS
jgi:hypothetical protein